MSNCIIAAEYNKKGGRERTSENN